MPTGAAVVHGTNGNGGRFWPPFSSAPLSFAKRSCGASTR